MPKGQASKTDLEIAQRLRAFRHHAGLTQTQVAEALGLTFQQIQKYEKGTNRIGPGKLDTLAKLFGVPVTAFYPSMDGGKGAEMPNFALYQSKSTLQLLEYFAAIQNPKLQSALVTLAAALADENRRAA